MTVISMIAGITVANVIFHGFCKRDWAKAFGISAIAAVLLVVCYILTGCPK